MVKSLERVDIGDWCTLYQADSVEIVDTLREHAVADAVIMDPPYSSGARTDRRAPGDAQP